MTSPALTRPAAPAAQASRTRRPHRLLGLARAELTLLLRNRMQLFIALVMPLAIPLMYIPLKNAGIGGPALAGALGSMYVVALLFVVYYNLLSTYVARRESLVLKRLRTGEASDATVLTATAVPAVVIALVMLTLMTALAVPLLDLPVPSHPLLLLAAVALGAAVFVPLALATANITRTVESAQVTCLPFIAIAIVGAGSALPLDLMPEWFRRIIDVIPTAPLVSLVRLGWLGTDAAGAALSASDVWRDAGPQAGILVIWFVLGCWFVSRRLRWEPRA